MDANDHSSSGTPGPGRGGSLVRPPRQERSRQSLLRLVRAAERVLDEYGVEGLTMASVAAAAGVSVGGIYRRFADKRELLRAVQDDRLCTLEEELVASMRAAEPRLEAVVAALVRPAGDWLRRHAGSVGSFYQADLADPDMRRRTEESYARLRGAFRDGLLADRGRIAHSDPEQAVRIAFALAASALVQRSKVGALPAPDDSLDWDRLCEGVAHACVSYLLTPPP
ncbi:TetR/AcrR family transcriptional regulator [Allonocardiopsis opalescens]|uniref:TetR/AcrR family transcriptional regulator n=1 Tax=Allonocardiopsis opalescens TaxID=1144618 RepID=UPI0014733256|nr:TetR/AcrR family transcriptional regulator [Allonocardiopsis opalescens]